MHHSFISSVRLPQVGFPIQAIRRVILLRFWALSEAQSLYLYIPFSQILKVVLQSMSPRTVRWPATLEGPALCPIVLQDEPIHQAYAYKRCL